MSESPGWAVAGVIGRLVCVDFIAGFGSGSGIFAIISGPAAATTFFGAFGKVKVKETVVPTP